MKDILNINEPIKICFSCYSELEEGDRSGYVQIDDRDVTICEMRDESDDHDYRAKQLELMMQIFS